MIKQGYPPIKITFNSFKEQLFPLFYNNGKYFNTEDLNRLYGDYKESQYSCNLDFILKNGYENVEEWANEYFHEWNLKIHRYELIINHPEIGKWIDVNRRLPEELISIIVYIEDEDEQAIAVYEKKEGFYLSYNSSIKLNGVTYWQLTSKNPK